MNTLDIILLVCFIPAIIRGLSKGFMEQAIALVSLLVGAWLAFKFGTTVAEWLTPYIKVSEQVLKIISFVVIIVVVVIVLNLIGKAIAKALKLALLGWLDKLLGLVFALLKATLIIGLLIMAFEGINNKTNWVKEETIAESKLYTPIKSITDKVFPYIKDFATDAHEALQDLDLDIPSMDNTSVEV